MPRQPAPFDEPGNARKLCPICRKPAVETVAPFCSKRCADVDLHRWLGGVYAIPDDEPGQPEATAGREGDDPVPDRN